MPPTITEWTAGGVIDWSSDAALETMPLVYYVEALRLAVVERLMVDPVLNTSRWAPGNSIIWECSLLGKNLSAMCHEIEIAINALVGWGFLGTQSGGGKWLKKHVLPAGNLTGQPTGSGVPANVLEAWSVDDLTEYVNLAQGRGAGQPFYATCYFNRDDVGGGGFDEVFKTEFIPACRWARQKYGMLNELTVYYKSTPMDTGDFYVDIVENQNAYYGRSLVDWASAAAAWADITFTPIPYDWRDYGLGAYRYLRSGRYQYFRSSVAPDMDMTSLSVQDPVSLANGYDFEKDIRTLVRLYSRSSGGFPGDLDFNDNMDPTTWHNEVGADNTYYEISTEISNTNPLWSIPRWPLAAIPPPIPNFPLLPAFGGFGQCGHWMATHAAEMVLDYAKPAGFQFV